MTEKKREAALQDGSGWMCPHCGGVVVTAFSSMYDVLQCRSCQRGLVYPDNFFDEEED